MIVHHDVRKYEKNISFPTKETTSWKNEAGSALQEKSHRKTCLEKWPADWCVILTLS